MFFVLKLSVLHFIFLNLFVQTHAQDIFGAILGGVRDGINLVNNNLGVGQRVYPDYDQPASRDVSFTRSSEVSESNQNDSEEPYNSNSEQHQGDDSDWNSEEYDKGKPDYIENKKTVPVHNHNAEQNRSSVRNPVRLKGNIKNKPNTSKSLLNNKKPLPLQKERLESNNSVTENNENFNNVTTIINNGSSTTSAPVVLPENSTLVDNKIPNIPVNSTSYQNTLNSTQPVKNNTIEKDNKYVLKALTKKKFFFQAKPVVPLSEEVSGNETIYYIDLD